jgi:hypothetical protein
LNSELDGLEEKFKRRKRDLEENSEKFNQEIKKLRDERPSFTEEKYREYAQLWTNFMRQQYAEYKADKDAPPKSTEAVETAENEDINAMEVDDTETRDAEGSPTEKNEENSKDSEESPTDKDNEKDENESENPEGEESQD